MGGVDKPGMPKAMTEQYVLVFSSHQEALIKIRAELEATREQKTDGESMKKILAPLLMKATGAVANAKADSKAFQSLYKGYYPASKSKDGGAKKAEKTE